MNIYKRHHFPPDVISYLDARGNPSQARGMRRFKSTVQAQRFLGVHSAVYNLFNLGRHLVRASHYRGLRQKAFASWNWAAAI